MDALPLRKGALLLGTLLLGGDAKSATIAEVLSRVQALRNATDFRATGRLVRVNGEQRKNYQFSIRAKTEAGVLRIFYEVTDPAPSRVRMLLESFADGRRVIRTGHPGDRAPSELAYERWGESLLDTDFSFEDLAENQFLWRNQTLVEEGTYGARPSLVVKSQPGAQDQTHYSTVTSWLDRDIYHPLKEEKVVKGSRVVKDFIFYGLRQSKGVWSASRIECTTQGKPGSTFLIVNRGAENARIEDGAFDPALLIKP